MTAPTSTITSTTAPEKPARGLWAEAWIRYKKSTRSMVALGYLGMLAFIGLFAPFIAGTKPIVCRYKGHLYFPAMGYYRASWENPIFLKDKFRGTYPRHLKDKDPESWAIWPPIYAEIDRKVHEADWSGVPGFEALVEADNNLPPSRAFPFGTDEYGCSVLARMIHGTSIALLVGFFSVGIAASIGITLGAVAGYFGGIPDLLLTRLMDVVLSIPGLILILALIAIVDKPTIWHVMAVLGCTGWVGIARLTRGEFLKLGTLDFVTAARALGLGAPRVIFRHMLPNALAPVLVSMSFGIAGAILTESGLSLLGFGVQWPTPSWGAILRQGVGDLSQWWLLVFPGIAIFLAVLTYNVIGDGLQQAIDPRLR